MATLTSRRSGWLSTFSAGRGFSKETASPLWAITAWIVGLIAFFPVLYMFLTGFKTENTQYRAIHSRDVNNYVAVKTDGKAKTKGEFATTGLMKNPSNQVCVDAVVEYLVKHDRAGKPAGSAVPAGRIEVASPKQ